MTTSRLQSTSHFAYLQIATKNSSRIGQMKAEKPFIEDGEEYRNYDYRLIIGNHVCWNKEHQEIREAEKKDCCSTSTAS